MKNMTLEHIAAVCGGTYIGNEADKKREIKGAVIDSRLVEKDYLFIPVRGEKVDGHSFIPSVFEKGALAVFSEEKLENPAGPYILVENTLDAMKKIAADYRRGLDIKVVGITGSVGKTSTKEMIASVLAQKYNVLKTEGNLNNEIGLPLTIFKIREEHQVAVLEMGISEFGEMDRLSTMANPDICVITNIGLCHLENLITRDGILKAKTESFAHLTPDGIAVLNGDDDKLCDKKVVNGKPAVFYGIEKAAKVAETEEGTKTLAEKTVYATNVEAVGLTGTKAALHYPSKETGGEVTMEVTIPIAGEHNVYNALAAIAVSLENGISMDAIRAGLAHFTGTNRRFEKKGEVNGFTIIDDYAHHPHEIEATLKTAQNYPHKTLWCIFQPHTYTRTKAFLPQFAEALSLADKVILADIYAARETDTLGISSEDIVKLLKEKGKEAWYLPTFDEIEKFVMEHCTQGDLLITMGAGDVVNVGENLLAK